METAKRRVNHAESDGFDFTSAIRAVITDMIDRLDELKHIDLERVALSFAQTRNRTHFGVHATLTPMRFEDGAKTTMKRGRKYTSQRLENSMGQEMLYILTFYLPRFMDTVFEEKLTTILHELWHISPEFNGDIRRHPGRCYAHTQSQQEYDARMLVLAKRWLLQNPPKDVFDFLRMDFMQLYAKYGGVFGTKIRHPKLIPVRSS